ncbi:UNVERIFIED_CONTAM: hypothetical protein FKN15_066671 [Acipenser sinensis]
MNEDSRNAVRKIYSPIARFLSLSQGDDKTPQRQRTKTRNQNRVEMESNCFSPVLGNEEDNEVFNPYAFIKNIPSQVGQYKIRDIPPKTRSIPESTLVLDLEETLVYSSLNVIENAEHTFLTHFQDQQYKIFVYTSAKKEYADEILDLVDPQKKLVRHRLYQEDCFCVQGHYIKDLAVLKRDLAKAVIVGNTPYTFPYQLMNMIPIPSWYGNKADQELQKLIPDLEKLSEMPSTPETMTSAAHLPASRQELKEFDSVKESISDIINQLQDIDPARLSFIIFSIPVIPYWTECSETSVAEEEGLVVVTVTSETSFLDAVKTDGHRDVSVPQSQGGIPNGTEENHPQALNQFELTNQEATRDEEQSFLGPPPHAETIELASHCSQGQPEDRPSLVTPEASDRGRCVCCGCCRSARLRAVSSVFASLLLLPAVLYGLYFYLPFDPPLCPDLTSRITFTIRCCVASAAPIILAVFSSFHRFSIGFLHPLEACPRGTALQQRFVFASVEQLLLYALNLVVMATFLEQEQLRAVPTLAGVFGAGSSLRGFSSGLTFFPLLAMAAFNLFCLFELGLSHLFPVPLGEPSSHTTPAPGLAILGG